MVNADFINVLNTALVALSAKYGVPAPSSGFEQLVDDLCVVKFSKYVANTYRDGISSIADEMEKIAGVTEMCDNSRFRDRFRGIETRDVEIGVKKGLWKRSAADREYWRRFDEEMEHPELCEESEKKDREEKRKYYKEYLIPIPPPSPTKPTELYLTMAYEPYDAIKSGEKVTEFRAYCESWVKRILANRATLKTVKFQRGYGGPGRPKPEQMIWTIKNIELYDIETRESSDPINVKEGFIPTHIAIDIGVRMDDVGPSSQKDN